MINIVLISLATWRMASLIATEKGPLNIFSNLRKSVAMRGQSGSKIFVSLSEGIHCLWCVSLWISPFLSVLVSSMISEWLFYTLSGSAGAILVDSIIRKLDGES